MGTITRLSRKYEHGKSDLLGKTHSHIPSPQPERPANPDHYTEVTSGVWATVMTGYWQQRIARMLESWSRLQAVGTYNKRATTGLEALNPTVMRSSRNSRVVCNSLVDMINLKGEA